MATSFRRPFQVMKRNMGTWQNGRYIPADMGMIVVINATIQMPNVGDMQKIEALPMGRRAARYIKVYTDTRLNVPNQEIEGARQQYPGDIIYYDSSHYLLFGESDFTMLRRSRNTVVSHWRYYGCEVIEGARQENAP